MRGYVLSPSNLETLILNFSKSVLFGALYLHALFASPQTPTILDEQSTRHLAPGGGSYVEIAGGLNYRDRSGIWKKSEPKFTADDSGFSALAGHHKVTLLRNLNQAGSVTYQLGKTILKSAPLCLGYFDPVSGKSIVMARLQDCAGELVDSNIVIYPLAFDEIEASVRFRYDVGRFHAEVIFHEAPPSPETFGLSTKSRLELMTEFTADSQIPQKRPRILRRESSAEIRASMQEPDFTDETLIFTDAVMGNGTAFDLSEQGIADTDSSISVGKQFVTTTDNRRVLIEAVEWDAIKKNLSTLPPARAFQAANLPTAGHKILAAGRRFPERALGSKIASLAFAGAKKGFVLDYFIDPSGTSYTFLAPETYYFTAGATFGYVTFQAGTFLKFANYAYVAVWGSIATPITGQKVVMTSVNDDLFGFKIPGSTGKPTFTSGNTLTIYNISNFTLQNLRVRWARVGVWFGYSTGVTVKDCIVEQSDKGLYAESSSTLSLVNVKQCSVNTPTTAISGSTISGSFPVDCGVVNATSRSGTQTESSIAVNPFNPNVMVVFAVELPTSGLIRSRSNDGGATWTVDKIAINSDFPEACCDPFATFDHYGNLFLVYVGGQNKIVYVLRSGDNGTTFTQINSFTTSIQVDQPTVVTGPGTGGDNGSVWVTYAILKANSTFEVLVSGAAVTGLNQTGTFTTPVAVSGAINAVFSDLSVGPSGQVICAFSEKFSPSKIWRCVDLDGLGSVSIFSAPALHKTTQMDWETQIPAQDHRKIEVGIAVAYDRSGGANNGRVYLLHVDRPPTTTYDTDMFIQYSDNNGTSWSAQTKVNDDNSGTSQFMPWMAIDQASGKIAVSWYDCRNDTALNRKPHMYASVSVNGGATFSKNFQLNPAQSDMQLVWNNDANYYFDYGDYRTMVYLGGYLYTSWGDNSNNPNTNPDGQNKLDVYIAKTPY